MMVIALILFVLLPMLKKALVAVKAKLEQGTLSKIHVTTGYSRRTRKLKDSGGRTTRRSLFRKADEKPAAVITFDGNLHAEGHDLFGQLADEVVENAQALSEVVVCINSPGGSVPPYGLMYAHMERLRKTGLPLTACIDQFGASGGYLTVAPATKIVASPLAMIGSIGVAAHVLNYSGLLELLGIESVMLAAGKHKRMLTATEPVTAEGREFTTRKLEVIHRIFINAVRKHRPGVDEAICDGDSWSAQECVDREFGLVDELASSIEYLSALNHERDLVYLSAKKSKFATPFFNFTTGIAMSIVDRVIARLSGPSIQL
jgi:serine protease SohB